MATMKQLKFIKAICDELGLDAPGTMTTREASRFISKHVSKFYTKKAKDNESSLQVSSGGNNLKSESLFKPTEKTNRISSEQNVQNMKALLKNAFGYDIWTDKKR